MSKTRNGIGFGYRTGMASKGSKLNQENIINCILTEDELNYLLTEDETLYLIQED